MSKQAIPVWGFPPEGLRGWPSDLQPYPINQLPTDTLILVHSKQAAAFQEQAEKHTHPDGRLQQAILYRTPDAYEPEDAWMYFDATIEAGNWPALRQFISCPKQITIAESALDVPSSPLSNVLSALTVGGDVPSLPEEVTRHLKECATCRQAFMTVLTERLESRYHLTCPPIERLDAHLKDKADEWVAAHLPGCSACRAEVGILRELEKIMPAIPRVPAWLEISLQQLSSKLSERWQAVEQSLAILVNSFLKANMRLVGSSAQRGTSTPIGADVPIEQLLQSDKGKVKLRGKNRQLIMRWSPTDETVTFEKIRGKAGKRLKKYQLVIQQGEKNIFSISSNQQGQAIISLKELEAALRHEKSTLMIYSKREEA